MGRWARVPPPWCGSIGPCSRSTRPCVRHRPGLPLASFASGSARCRASCGAGSTSLRTTRRYPQCSNACSSSVDKWRGRAARHRRSYRGGAPGRRRPSSRRSGPAGPRRAATSRPARRGHPPRGAGRRCRGAARAGWTGPTRRAFGGLELHLGMIDDAAPHTRATCPRSSSTHSSIADTCASCGGTWTQPARRATARRPDAKLASGRPGRCRTQGLVDLEQGRSAPWRRHSRPSSHCYPHPGVAMQRDIETFDDFWPHTSAHKARSTALHYVGTTAALGSVAAAALTLNRSGCSRRPS